ncbi:hypothetical protein H0266_10110 [Halobacillus locisalis]|uniref:Uncharacterized protein n=1 Tax=Halobacillus locisalis TaxID=220753 RepID=A0A838CTM0_9BACI|nr:hypothetical protein [Halobacillus locisalis]MBA2175248.1 hypothetical protein [Halobacillus locisalis]
MSELRAQVYEITERLSELWPNVRFTMILVRNRGEGVRINAAFVRIGRADVR